jgi:dihydrodipicolinate synthase/N-acetylneuraminate lyase
VGAQGVVVVTPYFYQLSATSLADHFAAVASAIDISLIAYHNVIVGPLPLEVLPEVIRRCPNFIGLKDGGHQMAYFSEACRMTSSLRPDFRMFTGTEYVATSMPVGGAGCFSPISELAPELVKSLVDACAAGDYEKAKPIQWKVSHLEGILGSFDFFSAHKPARALMGRPCGNPRMPIRTLDRDAVKRLEMLLTESGVLDDEPHGWT